MVAIRADESRSVKDRPERWDAEDQFRTDPLQVRVLPASL